MSRHTDLLDAVNDAKTEYERNYAVVFLAGWRAGQADAGLIWSGIEADNHSNKRFPGRPMCCGELLDWKPDAALPVAALPGEKGR